jgi:hypothetical protein
VTAGCGCAEDTNDEAGRGQAEAAADVPGASGASVPGASQKKKKPCIALDQLDLGNQPLKQPIPPLVNLISGVWCEGGCVCEAAASIALHCIAWDCIDTRRRRGCLWVGVAVCNRDARDDASR